MAARALSMMRGNQRIPPNSSDHRRGGVTRRSFACMSGMLRLFPAKASAASVPYMGPMNRRAILSSIAAAAFALSLGGCVRPHVHPRPGQLTLGMVTDVGGLGDKSFNDSAYNGLLRSRAGL